MHAFKLMNQANNATIKETVQLKLLESMAMYIGEKPILLPCSSTTALCRSRTGHSPHLQSVPSSAGCDFSKAFLSVQVSIITSTIQCNQNSRVMDHVQMGGGHPDPGRANLRSNFLCVVFFGTMMILRGSLLTQGVTSSSRAWSPWVSSETLMILNLRGSAVFTLWSNLELGQRKNEYYWLRIISNWCLNWAGNLKFHRILISSVQILEKDGRLPFQWLWQMFWRGSQPCSTPN